MTSSAWLAVGATIASLLGGTLQTAAMLLIGSALAVAVGGGWSGLAGTSGSRRVHLRAAAAISVGALAIAIRLLLSPAAGTAAVPLPEGSGPWTGTVLTVSSPRDGAQVATLDLTVTADVGPPTARTVAVAATLPRFPAIVPGDRVEVDGRLQAPPDGAYGDYLARIGVEATVFSRRLDLTGRDDDPAARLEPIRRGAGDALATAIPEPEAGLAAGIVIGLRDRVDRDLAAAFTTVGASHVVAISGWNIAIVASTVAALAGGLGRRRR